MSGIMSKLLGLVTNNSTEGLPEIHQESDLDSVEPGSLLLFQTDIQHYAVYLGRRELAHLNVDKFGNSGAFASTGNGQGYVTIERFRDQYLGQTFKCYVDNSKDSHWEPLSSAKIVQRARSKKGKVEYDLFSNNCEHFANWCRYDKSESLQVLRARGAASVATSFASSVSFRN